MRSTNTPSTVTKLFSASVKPANTRIDSKLEVRMNTTVSVDCTPIATYGRPSPLTRDRTPSLGKSSPMTCSTRGPASVMALTVETKSSDSASPAKRPPISPNAYSAAT